MKSSFGLARQLRPEEIDATIMPVAACEIDAAC
jgi:hypothetical protein